MALFCVGPTTELYFDLTAVPGMKLDIVEIITLL